MRFIGNVEKDAQVRAVASGALSTGDTVVVNADGTVSVVEGSDTVVGSGVVFETDGTSNISAAYDANAQKVVIAYRDNSLNYGTAVVGTVSGTSISFGTPVVFESATTSYTGTVYDTNAQKIVITYQDQSNSNYGTAIVGTVSGTSISFGSAVVFESATSAPIASVYDANAQKIVVAYRDYGNSFYGTAIVGTVSGTSISFGSPTVFATANISLISICYDSNAQKVVVAYMDEGNSYYGTAIVGTVSGTSISFGSAVVFESASSSWISTVYEPVAQKVVVSYVDGGNSSSGTAVVGTVSGTSISFSTPVVFNGQTSEISTAFDSSINSVVISYRAFQPTQTGAFIVGTVSGTSISFEPSGIFATAGYASFSVYDPDEQKTVISYYDAASGNDGTSVVVQLGSTNLTSENFLGFAAHTYADTQSALVNSTCTVDRNQTGLTAGQKYYVQTNGALGTTPGDPSVEAGTAISSTEIIVKG